MYKPGQYFIMQNDRRMEVGDDEDIEERAEDTHARDNAKLSDQLSSVNCRLFFIFSFSYILQGIVAGFIVTMPFVYPTLPSVNTMALFHASFLAYSFKFLLAPFLQKFVVIEYGKRKMYMMIGLGGAGITLLVSSFLTHESHCKTFALLMIIVNIFGATLGIASNALMIKELGSIGQSSIILSYGQSIGTIIGSFIILKFTSEEFASSVGLDSPITTPQVIIAITAVVELAFAVFTHFSLSQTILDSQRRGQGFSFCQVISYYSIYFKIGSRYCRIAIVFLLYIQGFSFFNSLYEYQLIKRGFSRDTFNTVTIVISIVQAIITFFLPRLTDFVGGRTGGYRVSFLVAIVTDLIILIWFPINTWLVTLLYLLHKVSSNWYFFVRVVQTNQFPLNALSGMFITFTACCGNFGSNTAIHTKIVGQLGWQVCSFVGLGYELLVVIFMQQIMDWIYRGDIRLPPQIEQKKDQGHQQLVQEVQDNRVQGRSE